MSVFGANDALRSFFLSKGCTYDNADDMQSMLLNLESMYPAAFQSAGPQMVTAMAPLTRWVMDQLPESYTAEIRTMAYNMYVMTFRGLRHFVTTEGMLEFVGERKPADVIEGKRFED